MYFLIASGRGTPKLCLMKIHPFTMGGSLGLLLAIQ